MKKDNLPHYAHLHLGLTRQELARRLELGLIDPQILRAQLDQQAQELKLEALCEKWLEEKAADQIDKFTAQQDTEQIDK